MLLCCNAITHRNFASYYLLDSTLVGHVLKVLTIYTLIECLAGCMEESKCLSVNYASSGTNENTFYCELNNAHSSGNHVNSLIHRMGSTHYSKEKVILGGKYIHKATFTIVLLLFKIFEGKLDNIFLKFQSNVATQSKYLIK